MKSKWETRELLEQVIQNDEVIQNEGLMLCGGSLPYFYDGKGLHVYVTIISTYKQSYVVIAASDDRKFIIKCPDSRLSLEGFQAKAEEALGVKLHTPMQTVMEFYT